MHAQSLCHADSELLPQTCLGEMGSCTNEAGVGSSKVAHELLKSPVTLCHGKQTLLGFLLPTGLQELYAQLVHKFHKAE